jgi:hypothetical protein
MPTLVDMLPRGNCLNGPDEAAYADGLVSGRVRSAVIRTADTGQDGELLLDVDPMALAASVNAEPIVGEDAMKKRLVDERPRWWAASSSSPTTGWSIRHGQPVAWPRKRKRQDS